MLSRTSMSTWGANGECRRGKRVVLLAQIGTLALGLAFAGCGGGGPAAGDGDREQDSGSGGKSSGGAPGSGASGGEGGRASGGAAGGGGDAADGAGAGGSGTGGGENSFRACPGTPEPVEPVAGCRRHQECMFGECREEYVDNSGVCGACFSVPNACSSRAQCAEGMACVPASSDSETCPCPGQKHCVLGCTSGSCAPGYVCGSELQCVPGSCVTDGYVCREGEVCDPERSTQPHGCLPASCVTDDYECAADRVCDEGAPGADIHGCRIRACSEGTECSPERTCDPGAAGVDQYGCRERFCEGEGYKCAEGYVCEPAHQDADKKGCRKILCTEGAECPVNMDCPESGHCTRRSCEVDSECECGACVLGHCHERLFYCVSLPS